MESWTRQVFQYFKVCGSRCFHGWARRLMMVQLCVLAAGIARAQEAPVLLYWEGFETNGWNGWTNDTRYTLDTNDAWVITLPTNGPAAAHQGSKCAATYGRGTDCYLVSPPLYLPPVNQYSNHVWLFYWQWQRYTNSITNSCLSDVKIREYQPQLGAWGPWNIIDPGTSGLIEPVQPNWRRRGIDLTLFNNDVVQLGFAHHGLGDPGWFVDEIEIWKVPVLTNVPPVQGFESGWGFWFNDRLCAWDIGKPSGDGPVTMPEGVSCAGTAMDGPPPGFVYGRLWTPAFYMPSLRPGEKLYLEFDQWWDFAFGSLATVEWTYWFPSTGWWYPQILSYDVVNNPARTWGPVAVDVSELAGNPLPIRLGIGYSASQGLGWFVDQVRVTHAEFRIVSMVREGSNLHLTWTAPAGTTNVVQCCAGLGASFTNLSAAIIATGTAQVTLGYVHIGAATNGSGRFYRVRQL